MRIFLFLVSFLASFLAHAQSSWRGGLKVSSDGHKLQYADGTPFFWLGDTGWELFHRLKLEETAHYLENRRQKGFNVIQAVILAEFDGLRKPNRYGELPLHDLDPTRPNEAYFRMVDSVVTMAEQKGLFMGLLPTWGDKVVAQLWGVGPVVFDSVNAYTYGLYLGRRYSDRPNIIWILGGDRPPYIDTVDWRPVWRAMARGIREAVGNRHLIAYHPSGGISTSGYLHHEPWLDLNMMQSGHGSGRDVPVWEKITYDYHLLPPKPTMDAEPNYEDHPVSPWPKWDPASGYYRDHDVRKQLYRSVFSGGCGVTYGHHSVWQFWNPREEKVNHADRYWTEAIDRPGARQAGYLRKLMESRPFLEMIPDTDLAIIPDTAFESNRQDQRARHMVGTRTKDGSTLMVYVPVGQSVTINTSPMSAPKVKAWWFNPRTGSAQKIGKLKRKPAMTFTPTETGGEADWVLVLDDARKDYGKPGD